MTEAQQAIADYRAAYEAAYGVPVDVIQDGGLFVVTERVARTSNYSLDFLRGMTASLNIARLQGGSDEH